MTFGYSSTEEIRLDGTVALVTGGGRGIGRAMALALSAAGAAVAVCARSEAEIAETAHQIEVGGGRALAINADMGNRQAIEGMVERVERDLGPIDLLVNNAAIAGTVGSIAETDPDAWWHVQEINLRGPLYCAHAVLAGMVERGHGRIINVSSGAADGPWPLVSAYAVSKAALLRLTENLALENQEQGIAVFAITPGLVHTAMVDGALHSGVPDVEQTFQTWLAEGQDVPPERAAQLVVLLASGQVDLLSGRRIGVADDIDMLIRRAHEIVERDLFVLRFRRLSE